MLVFEPRIPMYRLTVRGRGGLSHKQTGNELCPVHGGGTQGQHSERGRGGACAGGCWVWFVHRRGESESTSLTARMTGSLARGEIAFQAVPVGADSL